MENIENNRITPTHIESLKQNEIFVFGSNSAGFHSSGAAHAALQWGAVMGRESGQQGNTYAIPTTFKTVDDIKPYVAEFIRFAQSQPCTIFYVTEIGCGHAGHEAADIAPLFKQAMDVDNIYLPSSFWQILNLSFSERLKAILNHYEITPIELVANLGIRPSHAINLFIGVDHPNISDIQKILIKYPEINARWLLLGEGNIIS